MKIEKAKNEIIKNFKDLKIGEAFYPLDCSLTDLYIRTYISEYKYSSIYQEKNKFNTIKLSDGKPYWFSDFDKVITPNCKIVVE